MDPISIIALALSSILIVGKVIGSIKRSHCMYTSNNGEKVEIDFETFEKHLDEEIKKIPEKHLSSKKLKDVVKTVIEKNKK